VREEALAASALAASISSHGLPSRKPHTETTMTIESIILFLVVGGLAGFAAAKLMRGHGLGVGTNILVGIVGAFLGTFLFGLVGVAFAGLIGTFVTATIGAVVLLAVTGVLARRPVTS
jgi:uncharacterized membrane protein YeaQ/YmgE (transglycosylase-associated protein family)